MKRRSLFAGLALGASLLLSAGSEVHAQITNIIVTVDEDSHGTINGFLGVQPLPSGLAVDPGPGGLKSALTYDLLDPPSLVAGDVLVTEPGTGGLSDLIRFNTTSPFSTGAGSLVFYSETGDGANSLADTGFPTAMYPNNVTRLEIGLEAGPNGLVYTPVAGEPGFVAGAPVPVTYVIKSDLAPVPEPSTLALGLIGMVLGVATAWKRRMRARAAA